MSKCSQGTQFEADDCDVFDRVVRMSRRRWNGKSHFRGKNFFCVACYLCCTRLFHFLASFFSDFPRSFHDCSCGHGPIMPHFSNQPFMPLLFPQSPCFPPWFVNPYLNLQPYCPPFYCQQPCCCYGNACLPTFRRTHGECSRHLEENFLAYLPEEDVGYDEIQARQRRESLKSEAAHSKDNDQVVRFFFRKQTL